MTIIMADKNKETNAVATGIVLDAYQKLESKEIAYKTFLESINIKKVKEEVHRQRPVIEEQVGAETFNAIVTEVVFEYFNKADKLQ